MNHFHYDVMDALTRFEETGGGIELLEVLRRAAQYQIPAPEAAYLALEEILHRYHSAEARTLDEAFRVSRPNNWKQPPNQRKAAATNGVSKIGNLYLRGKELQAANVPTDDQLWELLAAEFYVSSGTARDWFYEVDRIVNR